MPTEKRWHDVRCLFDFKRRHCCQQNVCVKHVSVSGVDVCLNIHNAFAIYSFVCAMYVCSCTAFSRPLNVDRPILLTSIPIAILNESTYYCIPMNMQIELVFS